MVTRVLVMRLLRVHVLSVLIKIKQVNQVVSAAGVDSPQRQLALKSSSSCTCSAGFDLSGTSCVVCSLGDKCAAGAAAQAPCALGTFQNQTGQSACTTCPQRQLVLNPVAVVGAVRVITCLEVSA